jgi:hypothetical protein
MIQDLTLRPAQAADFAFCERTYFEPMQATIEKLGLDAVRHRAHFAGRWQVDQVRIAMLEGQPVGWLQTAPTDDAIFLACRRHPAPRADTSLESAACAVVPHLSAPNIQRNDARDRLTKPAGR